MSKRDDAGAAIVPREPKHPFDRWKGETARANRAFRDYAMMGEGRTLAALLEQYRKQMKLWKEDPERHRRPPTTSWATLTGWSRKFGWRERVRAWDELVREEEKRAAAALAKEWQEKRRKLLQAAFGRVLEALASLELDGPGARPSLGEVMQAIRQINDLLKEEFGDAAAGVRPGSGEVVGAAGHSVPPVMIVIQQGQGGAAGDGDEGRRGAAPVVLDGLTWEPAEPADD